MDSARRSDQRPDKSQENRIETIRRTYLPVTDRKRI